MTAAEAQATSDPRRSDRASCDTARLRGAVSAGRSAAACAGLNRARAWAGATSCGASARQPSRLRRAPWVQVGRQPGRRFGAADRFWAAPVHKTDASVVQAAGPALRAHTGR